MSAPRTPSRPRRRPAGAAPRRRGTDARTDRRGNHAAGTRAAGTRAADRELDAWFERAAADAPAPTETSFARLGLPQRLVTALERRDIRTAFPIQAATLTDALGGHDVLGRARTGSGKTLAFGLPMLATLTGARSQPRTPRGLVLVPTRSPAAPPSAARSRPSTVASTSWSQPPAGSST